MKAKYFLLSVMLLCLASRLSASFYNVKDFGAKGDGRALDSPAINKAIEKAASNGGGTIYFPAGSYLCYSIHLKNNITLFLDNGSVLLAAYPKKNSGYDIAEPNDFSAYQDTRSPGRIGRSGSVSTFAKA